MAAQTGISASYLNLIEHNKRRIGGRLLNDLSEILGVEPGILSGGIDTGLTDRLQASAAAFPASSAETARSEEFTTRLPGWSALVLAQSSELATLRLQVAALTDRLAHDPRLASTLHKVISTATAIRSTASILAGGETLDADWQGRFHQNIYQDSQHLAESSRSLAAVLEVLDENAAQNSSPQEALQALLSARNYHFAELENPPESIFSATADIEEYQRLNDVATRGEIAKYLDSYLLDATDLPLNRFSELARRVDYNPAKIAAETAAPLDQIFRRLASLPTAENHPDFGLAICDGGGALSLIKPVANFSLPHDGIACPLWPLFQSLSQPGQPIRQDVALPGTPAQTFRAFTISRRLQASQFDGPSQIEATMLLRPDPPTSGHDPLPLGQSCRICTRSACSARREASIFDAIP